MADCPVCGDEKAELGFNAVYCPNSDCSNFDENQLKEVLADIQREFDEFEGVYGGWLPFPYSID